MRIAGTSYNDSLVNQLNFLSSQQFQLQTQISTWQRIQKPEDDPAGLATALYLQTKPANAKENDQSAATLQTTATSAGEALQQRKTISGRAGEIATSAEWTASPTQVR